MSNWIKSYIGITGTLKWSLVRCTAICGLLLLTDSAHAASDSAHSAWEFKRRTETHDEGLNTKSTHEYTTLINIGDGTDIGEFAGIRIERLFVGSGNNYYIHFYLFQASELAIPLKNILPDFLNWGRHRGYLVGKRMMDFWPTRESDGNIFAAASRDTFRIMAYLRFLPELDPTIPEDKIDSLCNVWQDYYPFRPGDKLDREYYRKVRATAGPLWQQTQDQLGHNTTSNDSIVRRFKFFVDLAIQGYE